MHLTKLVTYLLLKLNYCLRFSFFSGTFPLIRILRYVNLYKLDVLVGLLLASFLERYAISI